LNDPADPGGDAGAVAIGGPLAAAPAETAGSGSAHGEQEAAGEPEPGTGQGDVDAAVADRKNTKRACLSEARKIVRQACHILTELGDDALTIT